MRFQYLPDITRGCTESAAHGIIRIRNIVNRDGIAGTIEHLVTLHMDLTIEPLSLV